jgi:large subunit ribosomal protein L22
MKKIFLQPNEISAVSKYIRVAPLKIRRVLKQIQGKSYLDALVILKFLPYRACEPILKVLRSAAANAKENKSFIEKNLLIKLAFVNVGPTTIRFRPRARGRAYQIQKSTSHITVILMI